MSRYGVVAVGMLGLVMAGVGPARADQVTGKFKEFSPSVHMFTIETEQTGIMLFSYNRKTSWFPREGAKALRPKDRVRVTFKMKGDENDASAVSRVDVVLPKQVQDISREDVALLMRKQAAGVPVLLIDPRPAEEYKVAHIPGAVSMPLDLLERHGGTQLPAKKDTILIFYGEGETSEIAADAATLAHNIGYLDVRFYRGGTLGWEQSGGLLETTVEHLRKDRPVLIDLRDPATVAKGYIDGASNIPFSSLAASEGKFPVLRSVPITLYGDSDQQLHQAAAIVRKWGYRNISIYSGGVTAWQQAGEVLKTGKAPGIIYYSTMSHSGELTPDDIPSAIGSPLSIVMLDLRSAADYAAGHLQNSMNIPMTQLPAKFATLPKKKMFVAYGSDGVTAEMAYDFLRKKGYMGMFLGSGLKIAPNGSYVVK